MLTSHELLLKYRHDARFSFNDLEVCYVDRGAPDDLSCVRGEGIRTLGPYYFEVAGTPEFKSIPYHRIRTIRYAGKMIWGR